MGLLSGLFTRRGVRFVRTRCETRTVPRTGLSEVVTYDVYSARTAGHARDFLNGKTVTEPLRRILVETPEGNWSKGIEGLCKE